MKVVHVISGLKAGGAEQFVFDLCRESLKHKEIDVSVVSLSGADQLLENYRLAGIETFSIGPIEQSRGMKAFTGFRKLLFMKADVIHAHMFHACVVACAVKIFRPACKIVFTLHNNYVPQLHRRLLFFVTRPFRSADILFPGLQRKWYQKQKAVKIPVAIDVGRFDHLVSDKPPLFTITFLGRLSHEKNPLALVEIAKKLAERHHFVIRVAGEGPLKDVLQQQIAAAHLNEFFIVHGYVREVTQLLSESHCVVIPSKWEGMPLALLEAGAAGVPVIATGVGNIPSILSAEDGYVAALNEFPKVVERVMDNYGAALIKARNLMHKVRQEFSIRTCYEQHVDIYSQA